MRATRGAAKWLRPFALIVGTTAMARAENKLAEDPSAPSADDKEAIVLHVSSGRGDECPSSTTFFQSIQQRAPGIRLAHKGEPARLFSADWHRQDERTIIGSLRVQDVGGDALVREVSGRTCSEVAEALALIAAIALRSPPAEETSSPDMVPNPAPVPIRVVEETPPTKKPPAASAPAAPVVTAATDWHILLRSFVSVREQILPMSLYGAALGPEVVIEAARWQPSFGVALGGTLAGTASTDTFVSGSAMRGRLLSAQFFASPIRLRLGRLELRPYAALEIGELLVEGQGVGLLYGTKTQELWISAAISGQATLRFGDRWFLGASGSAEAHPIRYTFRLDPRDVYQVGPFGFSASASISFRID